MFFDLNKVNNYNIISKKFILTLYKKYNLTNHQLIHELCIVYIAIKQYYKLDYLGKLLHNRYNRHFDNNF